ncbi:MAG: hypothetical protein KF866_07590 [Phycisphaeraceae bacterium]|nr:hypothetical protein [Phycisphaeraceae bacterium]MCW5753741.1 hypothetical protein [Phycisphaeraceae bacterium]
MPPLPRLRVAALADLLGQLRFASRDALMRDLDRAESLARDIDPDTLYDEAWLVEQITGFSPRLEEPATLVGMAVLADLSALVENLCDLASLHPDDAPAGSIDAAALADRWQVSRKTIDRYRRQGLIARRVSDRPGRAWLVFTPVAVEAFERRHAEELARASGFTRIDAATRARMIRRATRYRRRFRASLNEAALRLAERFGRSHEAVRQVLLRHDRTSDQPIFAETGPIDAREMRLCLRAADRAIEPSLVARRLRRSAPVIRRAVNIGRLQRLRVWLPAHHGETDEHAGVLSHPSVISGLGAPGPTDLLDLLEEARQTPPPVLEVERVRAAAARALRVRAAATVASINPGSPQSTLLDRAETDLRWSARLMAELLRAQLPTIIRTLTTRLGRPPEEIRAASLRRLLDRAFDEATQAIVDHDPGAGGRLAARISLSVDRIAERWLREHPQPTESGPGRAAGRLPRGAPCTDFTRRVAPWQATIDLESRHVRALSAAPEEVRRTIELRFGLGTRPLTLDELATSLGVSRIGVARFERRMIRDLRALARVDAHAAAR